MQCFSPHQQLHDESKHRHRARKRNDGIVREYSDLTTGEIKLLTKILSHAPKQRNSPNVKSYERFTRDQISRLPSQLKAKIPWLSTFCSLHHKINPWPVNSILEWIKDEIDTCLPAVWSPLRRQGKMSDEQVRMIAIVENLRCLWTPSDTQEIRSGHRKLTVSFGYGSAKCGGCVLSHIGGHGDVLIAIGALFIGRIRESIHKSSKRIVWIESWIRDAMEDAEVDRAIQKMWKLGSELRELRKKANVSGRAYVEEYAQKARASRRSPVQSSQAPKDSNPFDDRQHAERPMDEVTADDLFGGGMDDMPEHGRSTPDDPFKDNNQADGWLDQVATADDLFDNRSKRDQVRPADEIEPDADAVEQDAASFDFDQDFEANHLFRPSSSVYSQRSERSRASSHGSTDELLDMYRHSKYTMDGRPF